MTGSAAGLRAYPYCGHYVMAKHGLVGLMRTLALVRIRFNRLLPGWALVVAIDPGKVAHRVWISPSDIGYAGAHASRTTTRVGTRKNGDSQ